MAGRRPLVAANWKMNHLRRDAEAYCRRLTAGRGLAPAVEVVIFPGFTLLPAVAEGLAYSAAAWGGQDLHPEDAGAHTGDVSASQLADAGCRWALCGHSERRHGHGDGDELVAAKIRAALRHRLAPMVCVGETGEERRAGRTEEVVERQLGAALDALGTLGEAAAGDRFALAYEPVWAIGTGETATPETAQQAHAFLRRRLAARLGDPAAAAVRLVYGGSVTPDNAAGLWRGEDVDGFLVGGAGLDPARFLAIISVCG
jgi:triosephosphate isomerase